MSDASGSIATTEPETCPSCPWYDRLQFWVTIIGAAGIIIGSILQVHSGSVVVIAASSALMILGTLLLAWRFWDRATA